METPTRLAALVDLLGAVAGEVLHDTVAREVLLPTWYVPADHAGTFVDVAIVCTGQHLDLLDDTQLADTLLEFDDGVVERFDHSDLDVGRLVLLTASMPRDARPAARAGLLGAVQALRWPCAPNGALAAAWWAIERSMRYAGRDPLAHVRRLAAAAA